MHHHHLDIENEQVIAIQSQIPRWTFTGPLTLATTLVILLAVSQRPLLIAFAAIIGLPFCWRWGLSGAAGATIGTIAAFALQIAYISGAQPYWQLLLTCSFILSFYITALCRDEVDTLFNELGESIDSAEKADDEAKKSKQINFEDEMNALDLKFEEERKIFGCEISRFEQMLKEKNLELLECHAKISNITEKLQSAEGHNEEVLQELFQRRHEYTLLKQSSEITQEELSQLRVNSEEQLAALQAQLENTTKELSAAEFRHAAEIDKIQLLIAKSTPAETASATVAKPEEKTKAKPAIDKERPLKPTKTTAWADKIMSRCADPDKK
jgi:septal ring factor EnvC (AmiA/AmiB activator)